MPFPMVTTAPSAAKTPSVSPPPRGISRRAALTLAVVAPAAVLAGCRRRHHVGGPVKPQQVDPDVVLAAKVLDAESTVLALVGSVVEKHPGLGRSLAEVERAHRAHIRLLAHALPATPSSSPSPSGGASATKPRGVSSEAPSSAPVKVPRHRRQALRVLAAAEDSLAASDRQAAFAALSGHYARVLASMAASAAQQAAVVRAEMPGAHR